MSVAIPVGVAIPDVGRFRLTADDPRRGRTLGVLAMAGGDLALPNGSGDRNESDRS